MKIENCFISVGNEVMLIPIAGKLEIMIKERRKNV